MATIDKIRLSGTTYDIIDSTAIHSLDGYWTSGQTNAAIGAATEVIGQQLANKADTSAVTASIAAATSGKADTSAVVTDVLHSFNTGLKSVSIGKTKNGTNSYDVLFSVGSGLTLTNVESKAKIDVDGTIFAQKGEIPSVTEYADAVKYNSTSKYVEFYHGGTGGTKVYEYDASPFLIDGMVQNVEIKDVTSGSSTVTCLVISFNTDAGKQDINIPISQIFDASNYYTTAQTDTKISQATSGKADSSDVYTKTQTDTKISQATSGKADSSSVYTKAQTDTKIGTELSAFTYDKATIDEKVAEGGTFDPTQYYTKTDTDTLLNAKQATLVSGTNIKTVGGQSVLGSGNVKTLHANLDGTTLVFTES